MNRNSVYSIIWNAVKAIVPIGIFIGGVIYVGGFVIEVFYAICLFCTCSSKKGGAFPYLWSWEMFFSVFFYCILVTLIIALFKGFFQAKKAVAIEVERQRNDQTEYAISQRRNWASEVKRDAQTLFYICNKNLQDSDNTLPAEYKIAPISDETGEALTRAAAILGQLDAIVDEINSQGGKE